VAFWTDPNEDSLASYEALCLPTLHAGRATGWFYERAVRNPAMRLVFFETEFRRLDLLRQLDRIKCPTLIVTGEDDPIRRSLIWRRSQRRRGRIWSRFVRFANAGHGAYRDQPGGFFPVLAIL
jgi:proline iminopeptidase